MEVTVKNLQRACAIDRERVRRLAELTLETVGRPDGSCAVVFVGSRKIREMNRMYRETDSVTDVLAFPQGAGPAGPESGEEMGDVVIAPSRAAQQVAGSNRKLAEEIDLLVVHGVLHLAGYVHGDAVERQKMERLEEKILGAVRS